MHLVTCQDACLSNVIRHPQKLSPQTIVAKISLKKLLKTSLVSFFAKGKRPNEETEEEPTTSMKKEAAFKRRYQESYFKYGFVPTGDSHVPMPLCIVCGDRLANKAMKPSRLLGHKETKHPGFKDKPWEFF